MIMQYINSQGIKFELYNARARVISGNFHARRWKLITKQLSFGERIDAAEKDPIDYEIVFSVRGSLAERKDFCNRFTDASEYDIRKLQTGKLVYGDYSIDCFVTDATTGIAKDMVYRTEIKAVFHCSYPFWIKIQKLMFTKDASAKYDTDGMDYPYDYPYDYAIRRSGARTLQNDSPFDSRFKLTIFGPAVDPFIEIAGHKYAINGEISSGERIEIDSINKTVYKIGSKVSQNWIGKRYKLESIFEPVPPGINTLNWDGLFGFNIDLYDERSEPPWVITKDTHEEISDRILLADKNGTLLMTSDGLYLEVIG